MITRVDCACTLHMLEVEVMDDGAVFLSSWRIATSRHEYGTLRQRVAEAWRALRGWDVAGDEYVLEPDAARKLAAALSTPAAGFPGEDSGDPAHGLVEWLASPAARQFEGRWVLLSDDYDVVDSDDSPSELMDRHPEERTPIIVFVRPSNMNYVFGLSL